MFLSLGVYAGIVAAAAAADAIVVVFVIAAVFRLDLLLLEHPLRPRRPFKLQRCFSRANHVRDIHRLLLLHPVMSVGQALDVRRENRDNTTGKRQHYGQRGVSAVMQSDFQRTV